MDKLDVDYMEQALRLAHEAADHDEVPVGALVVKDDKVISTAYNLREDLQDPTAHAEVIAIKKAAEVLKSWRLEECTLYVTLEPCPMCLGTAINARIKRIVFGAYDPKSGACGSAMDFSSHSTLNHSIDVSGGVLADKCGQILTDFFRTKRGVK